MRRTCPPLSSLKTQVDQLFLRYILTLIGTMNEKYILIYKKEEVRKKRPTFVGTNGRKGKKRCMYTHLKDY